MRTDITETEVNEVINQTMLITQQTKGHESKSLSVNFDKEFIVHKNGVEKFSSLNKIIAINRYNEIKL